MSLLCSLLFIFLRIDVAGGILIVGSVLFAAIALILGVIALFVITNNRKQSKGYVHAIASILLSTPFVLMFLLSMFVARVRAEREKANTGLYNIHLLGEGLIEYAKDHNGYLPDANKWCDLLIENNNKLKKENFRFPRPDRFHLKGECHFAFNKNLSSMHFVDIPGDVVLLFEADGDWNLHGTEELLNTRSKEHYISLLLVNGTVKDYWFNKKSIRSFDSTGTHMYYEKPRWKP